MNVQKFYGIKTWAAIARGENGKSEDKFLGESVSYDMFIVNPVMTTFKVKKVSRLQRKKSQMQTAWVHKQNLHFLHKMQNVTLPEQK